MAHRFTLGTAIGGELADVTIDTARLLETRLLVTANSGAGKSWLLRRLIEQTHGQVPQLVIDPEGEYRTLRDRFDFVIAGARGDCPAEVRSASLLARRLSELGASAVVDLSELRKADQITFVRLFLESLVGLPPGARRSAMVIIDEASTFAAEKGAGESPSAAAVIDLMRRGRKRGLCGILATQRLSDLSKSAAAEATNRLVGRTTMDLDVARAMLALGLSGAEARAKLKKLPDGRFYAHGPAVADDLIQVQVGGVETRHPRPGQVIAPPTPPRGKVLAVLGQLADLPAEAEAEARTADELRARVRDLERQLHAKPAPAVDQDAIDRAAHAAYHRGYDEGREVTITAARHAVTDAIAKVAAQRPGTGSDLRPTPQAKPQAVTIELPRAVGAPRKVVERREPAAGVTAPMQRVLDAIAWWRAAGVPAPDATALAFKAGYSPKSSGFQNLRGALRTAGLVEYLDGGTALTAAGDAIASPPARATAEEIRANVLALLDRPARKVLGALLDAGSHGLTHDQLAEATDYSATSSGFQNLKGRLRSLGLVEYPTAGRVRAADILYPEGR